MGVLRANLLGMALFISGAQAGIEIGETIRVSGAVQLWKGCSWLVTPEGHAFRLIGEFDSQDHRQVRMASMTGYYSHEKSAGRGEHVLVLTPGKAGRELALELARKSGISPRTDLDQPRSMLSPLDFLPPMQEKFREFALSYLPYVRDTEKKIVLRYARLLKARQEEYSYLQEAPEGLFVSVEEPPDLSALRQEVFQDEKRRFFLWNVDYRRFREAFVEEVLKELSPGNLYLHFSKRDYLLYLRLKSTKKAVFAFPVAYGYNPDGGHKLKTGDGRTPQTPEGFRTLEKTPFYIGRRIDKTCKPGMTGSCLGVQSRLEEDQFWVQYGMNVAIHGSADIFSMGTRSSNGCLRLYNQDAILLYELTQEGTPLIVE